MGNGTIVQRPSSSVVEESPVKDKQVARRIEIKIPIVSSLPVFWAGGKVTIPSRTKAEAEVMAAHHLAEVSMAVGECSELACER